MATVFNPFTKKLDIVSEVTEGSDFPASASNGAMFFDTDNDIFYVYLNGRWIEVGSAPGIPVTSGMSMGLLLALTYP